MSGTFVAILVVFAASIGIQFWLNRTYANWSRVANSLGVTGAQVARAILDSNGLTQVRVEEISGQLSDHYHPIEKVVRLSSDNYRQPSVAAAAIAAHECGHAIQDARSYAPLVMRQRLLPALSISSMLWFWIFLAGMLLGSMGLAQLGVILFTLVAAFHLITLPVEFNASSRALTILQNNGILQGPELNGGRKVLTAAAMTYVAGLAAALAQLIHMLAITGVLSEE